MRILVTGASGFIGANLVRRLLDDGAEVHLLLRPTADRWRLADVLDRVRVHAGDLLDADRLRDVLAAVRPTHVVHLATYGGYPTQTDPRQVAQTNVLGTIQLLRAAEAVGFEMFINTGSSSEYGVKTAPMREDDTLQPADVYGASKAAATAYCRHRGRDAGVPIVTLRPFSVYGPYEAHTRLFPTAVTRVLRGEPVHLAHASIARDFTAVNDVVEGYLAALRATHLRGETINLASGRQTTLADFAAALLKVTGGRARVQWDASAGRPNDTTTWVGDPTRAQQLLGWRATTSLATGLRIFFEWMKSHANLYAHT